VLPHSPAALGGSRYRRHVHLDESSSPAAERFRSAARSRSTTRGYGSDWRDFEEWCSYNGLVSLPATEHTVANYLASMASDAGAKKATVLRRLAAINDMHERSGFPRPSRHTIVSEVVSGVRRDLLDEVDSAAPFTIEMLHRAAEHLRSPGLANLRDRALLCLGFAAALRRSELVAVRVEDLSLLEGFGYALTIPRSKTDQESKGVVVAVPFAQSEDICPVRAVREWLECSEIRSKEVLRGMWKNDRPRSTGMSPASVNMVVKRVAEAIGEDPAGFSGHSLRAGFVTSARAAGVPDHVTMYTTRHKDARTLSMYDRPQDVFASSTWSHTGW
jgi:site-specific recombinase XerD